MQCEQLIAEGWRPLSESSVLKVKKSNVSPVLAGLFLFIFFLTFSLYVPLPTPKNPIRFYNSEKRADLSRTLCVAIKKAQKSITLHTYSLTDTSLLTLLKKRGKEGITINLYYDKKASPSLKILEEENFHFHPTTGKGLFHEKIWIIDEKLLFLGSTNLTPSSLKMHDNLMVGLYAPPLAEKLSQKRPDELELLVGNHSVHYFSLPSSNALEALLRALNKAEREVFLYLFTFTHPLLAEKLIELHKKGVKITLNLDGTTARGASKNVKKLLENEGISVQTSQGLQLLHHKWAVIDQKTHILGSANWTKAAFNKNKDFILIINNK